jgi:hypothetical protein
MDTYKILRNKILVYKTISLFVHIKETINCEICLDDLVKEEAKEALYGHISNSSIPYSDFKHCMMNNEARVRIVSIVL